MGVVTYLNAAGWYFQHGCCLSYRRFVWLMSIIEGVFTMVAKVRQW